MMRAKMSVSSVMKNVDSGHETVTFYPVSKSGAYPPDGSDEDNSYAKWSPSGKLELQIANPALWGKFKSGDKFYLDFTPVPVEAKAAA